ncbi:MAG: TetR/AcrR family transcriptional regulator [Kineosporiaceae bacterium]
MTVVRRTQQQRRQATRATLLTAALDQLLASGLAGFTTTEVCRRAGLSQGALFKHFATKADLLGAVAEHLFDVLRADYERRFRALGSPTRTLSAALDLLWRQMLDERLAAAFELYTAARTDAELRSALQPVVAAHVARIYELGARLLPEVEPERLRGAVELTILAMQGLVLQSMALRDPDQQRRLHDLMDQLAHVMIGEA